MGGFSCDLCGLKTSSPLDEPTCSCDPKDVELGELRTQLATANTETASLGRELEEARVALRSVKAPPGGLERAIQEHDRNWCDALLRATPDPEVIERATRYAITHRPPAIAAVFAALRAQADAPTKEGAD